MDHLITKNLLKNLSIEYKTPFFVYDEQILTNTYNKLKNALHEKIEVFYSVKANPNVTIVNHINNLGAGLEISSESELICALKAGANSKDIIFVGPGKTAHEIEFAISHDVYCIVVESIQELDLINTIGLKYNRKINIALRVNPSLVGRGSELIMSGTSSKFGIDEDWFYSESDINNKYKFVHIIGIHTYMGTGILDWRIFFENTKYILEMAARLSSKHNFKLEMIDFGGGLMPTVYEQQGSVNLDEIKKHLSPFIDSYINDLGYVPRLILESGRYLVAQCGFYVTKVLYTKESRGKRFAITDGGIHQNIAAAGGIRKNTDGNFITEVISSNNRNNIIQNVGGPLCTPADMLLENVLLPELEQGDLIVLKGSGAYGLTASPSLFLSQGYCTEIWVYSNNNEIGSCMIRKRQMAEDVFRDQILFSNKNVENLH
ncbi:hypothetical protein T458_24435 [Brevibacillus panacihumi W25]|uniref:Diaminopimelate decarboxylase n=1 Tax=Brevibacillus panacihumi W25 TaxID=1408254 RepID=V6M0M7_9BACL|nr:hypothetical protein [Brevibacillus panacihumi]EST52169.1 hypothetical protein T458_24435 [Brevibacillus panacihumi W25]